MKIKIIKLGLLAILIASVILGIAAHNKKTAEQTEFEKEISNLAETTEKGYIHFSISIDKHLEENMLITDTAILQVAHRMAHPYVEATEKWGGSFSTDKEDIKILMIKIEQSETMSKEMKSNLIGYLGEYYEDDFTKSVYFHNYVWREQEGNVGKATGLSAKAK